MVWWLVQAPDREFLIRCSYVEIYNERIRDLLHPDTPELKVHESVKKGVHLHPAPKEVMITHPRQIRSAAKKGDKKRSVGATDMNERSSRSHTIFRIVVESRERREDRRNSEEDIDAVLVGALTLVDLAGSESVRLTGAVRIAQWNCLRARAAAHVGYGLRLSQTGKRQKEAGKINTSLLSLCAVCKALARGDSHVPFRNSTLTRILQPSLAGNTRTAIICAVSPAAKYLEETKSTLSFARSASALVTQVKVNEVMDDKSMIKKLHAELRQVCARKARRVACPGGGWWCRNPRSCVCNSTRRRWQWAGRSWKSSTRSRRCRSRPSTS